MIPIVTSIIAVIFFATTLFLGKELLKKFGFMQGFIQSSNQMVAWKYFGGRKPGMYNIVLRGKTPFYALIGLRFNISMLGYSGFDHYGFAKSGDNNVAVFSTYLGKGPCEFQFVVNTNMDVNSITATSSEEDQLLKPDSKSAPHWFQRIGF